VLLDSLADIVLPWQAKKLGETCVWFGRLDHLMVCTVKLFSLLSWASQFGFGLARLALPTQARGDRLFFGVF
jgi:hypothetical protein